MSRSLVLSSGRPGSAEVLVISSLHPFPPRSGSAVRMAQYIRFLAGRGLRIDLAVLSDSPSAERDLEAAREALRHCRKTVVVRRPVAASGLVRLAHRTLGRMLGVRLGGGLRSPGGFVREVRRILGGERYLSVVVSGVPLARAAGAFRPPARRILDAQTVWYDRFLSFTALGRGAELEGYADPRREARIASGFDAVVAASVRDASILREIGVRAPIVVVPIACDGEIIGSRLAPGEPTRPPRILFVAGDGPEKLDGLRFFRSRVLPAIRRRVPTCRLRVVGLAARSLDPGPGVELPGPSDRLADEYRAAAAVAVPIRVRGGLNVQAVEALAHGKALLATTAGAEGIELVPGRDAVVSDDPAVLAREAVRILCDDSRRRDLEENARALASRLFDPERVFLPFLELLGVESRPIGSPASVRAAALAP